MVHAIQLFKQKKMKYVINNTICFFDIYERKIKQTISNISKRNDFIQKIYMITKDLLFIGGESKISIVNVNQYNIVRVIDTHGSSMINCICMLNQNVLLTGDQTNIIRQWRIEGDNLILISKGKKIHKYAVYSLVNLGDGHIASCSGDYTIRIWQ